MKRYEVPRLPGAARLKSLQARFAGNLGVDPVRRREIHSELARATRLGNADYWLELLFSAGIATLGLVLNSPAVIIGAMLISPLMGPILANGLALAAGDLVLGIRGAANLALSCAAAVGISTLLIVVLPFKEITAEISARVQPNTLDLFVALFSGAVGSVAICKVGRGIVTSIPGVAVAVALMPPLCVCGYGIGYALSLNGPEGLRVAQGGALLFLTNLVAITFTAMVAFLVLRLGEIPEAGDDDAAGLPEPEAEWWRARLSQLHVPDRMRHVVSLPGRLALAVLPLLLVAVPLGQSFAHLQREFALKRSRLGVQRAATEIWQENYGKLPNGQVRSYLGQVAVSEQDGKLMVQLRAFTRVPCTPGERAVYPRLLAARLARPPGSVSADIVEIPTAAGELRRVTEVGVHPPDRRTFEARRGEMVADLRAAVAAVHLPATGRLAGWAAGLTADSTRITLAYLSDRELGADARQILAAELVDWLAVRRVGLDLQYLGPASGSVSFRAGGAGITGAQRRALDPVGGALSRWPLLRVKFTGLRQRGESEALAARRSESVAGYLRSRWGIGGERIETMPPETGARAVRYTLTAPDAGRDASLPGRRPPGGAVGGDGPDE